MMIETIDVECPSCSGSIAASAAAVSGATVLVHCHRCDAAIRLERIAYWNAELLEPGRKTISHQRALRDSLSCSDKPPLSETP